MGLAYTSVQDVQISKDEGFRISTVNAVIKRLIDNDRSFFGITVSPGIWERRWYNGGGKDLYYRKGDAVWINTEQADDFVMSHIADIDKYAQEYAPARYRLMSLSAANDTAGIYRLYRDMALGLGDFAQRGPIYYLGNLLDHVQIRVSLSDDNSREPSDNAYWKDFFDRSRNRNFYQTQILSAADEQLSATYEKHLADYHLNSAVSSDSDYKNLYGKYLQTDMSNVRRPQNFVNHSWYQPDMTGFDYVVRMIVKKLDSAGQYQWFRVWKSGLLEHGGMVKVADGVHSCGTNDSSARLYTVPFAWEYNGKKAPVYDFPASGIGGFYSQDNQIYTGSGTANYVPDIDALGRSKRYVIDVSPVQSLGGTPLPGGPYPVMQSDRFTRFPGKEVTKLNNGSFTFYYASGIKLYSYYVKGFVANKAGVY